MTEQSEPVVLCEVRDGVAFLTLNRPEAANALDMEMSRVLMELAIRVDEDPNVGAVVLTGRGRFFCAGGDLAFFGTAGDELGARLKEMTAYFHAAISRFARMDAPLIGAVSGVAAGAGFSLAAACDLVVAGESSMYTMAYTAAGLSPDGSSTWFLPRRIGDRRTRELMLTNRRLSAAEALDWGVVNAVVPDDKVLEEASSLATTLAAGPTGAYGAVKSLLAQSFENGLETQMELEARAIAAQGSGPDGREGIDAFLAKRKPNFRTGNG